jgi:hypothetical protein
MTDFFKLIILLWATVVVTLGAKKPSYATARTHGFEKVYYNFTDFTNSLYTILPSSPNYVLIRSNL